jgi:hypothetical protein
MAFRLSVLDVRRSYLGQAPWPPRTFVFTLSPAFFFIASSPSG